MKKFLISLILALSSSVVMAAGGGETLEQSGADLNDKASLQRGAKLFVNYCMGCHSLKYMRYSRVATDLNLSEEEVQLWLNFTGAKFGEPMVSAMKPEDAALMGLYYLQEQSVKEISEITGLTESNVKIKLFRLRDAMKTHLTRRFKQELNTWP